MKRTVPPTQTTLYLFYSYSPRCISTSMYRMYDCRCMLMLAGLASLCVDIVLLYIIIIVEYYYHKYRQGVLGSFLSKIYILYIQARRT
jgi:hypothetical protein